MPPQLSPAENFPIVRVLQDHTDVSTNYVQAVIRDATTDALLATVSLDDKGNRRFQKLWKVPWDNTFANGRWVVITTTVYTDSGYTTKNPNYGEVGDTYLVQQRWSQGIFTGAGGDGFDAKQFRKILAEEVAKIVFPEIPAFPQIPAAIDYTPQLAGLRESLNILAVQVEGIQLPEQQKLDLGPVLRSIGTLGDRIKALPAPADVDYSKEFAGITKDIADLSKQMANSVTQVRGIAGDVITEIAKPQPFFLPPPPDAAAATVVSTREARLKKLKIKYKL